MSGNQYQADPRQAEFLKNYLNPKSKTFSNALQSALKAGYSQEYSENITNQMPDWLAENLGNEKMLNKALKNLNKILDLPIEEKENLKVVADISKFATSRLGKDKGWSDRTELTGADGKDLPTPILGYEISEDNSDNKDNTAR